MYSSGGVIHNGGGDACVGTEKFVLCFEPKASLKNKIFKEKKRKRKKKGHNSGMTERTGETETRIRSHTIFLSLNNDLPGYVNEVIARLRASNFLPE